MHIPDNYLSPSTCAVMGAAMIPVWAVSVRKIKEEVSKTRIPLLGIGAAYSFLIMMFNVPLPGGTTGHVVGGTLLAILLGPYSACISLTVALLLQALLFQDGGIIAFGANCFNMAFIMPFLGYFIYKFIKDRVRTVNGEYAGIILGSFMGINFAALAAAVEFGIQPLLFKSADGKPLYCPYSLSQSIPAMVFSHLTVAGVLEVVFTVAVISFIKRVSPGIVYAGAKQKLKPVYSLILLLICLSPLGLIATGTAWGEWGIDEIQKTGYVPEGMKNGFKFNALMSDYALKGIPDVAGYILSAVAGTAILVIVFKIASTFGKKSENANG